MSRMLKVRAIADGYYEDVFRRPGDEFEAPEALFSSRWMVAIDDNGKALKNQPEVKGKRRDAKEAANMASLARSEADARQAQVESAMSATLGEVEKVVDAEAAAGFEPKAQR